MNPKTPLQGLVYTALDLEATDLDPTRDRLVALGAVRLVGGRLGAELELLLDPGRPVSREAQALHGLSREALRGRPTLEEALPTFLAFLQGTVLLAHQAHVDLAFLPALKGFPLLDTYLLARFLLPGTDPRLEALAARFGLPLSGRHTALGDARLVAEVFRHLLPLLEAAGVRTLEAARLACLRAAEGLRPWSL